MRPMYWLGKGFASKHANFCRRTEFRTEKAMISNNMCAETDINKLMVCHAWVSLDRPSKATTL